MHVLVLRRSVSVSQGLLMLYIETMTDSNSFNSHTYQFYHYHLVRLW